MDARAGERREGRLDGGSWSRGNGPAQQRVLLVRDIQVTGPAVCLATSNLLHGRNNSLGLITEGVRYDVKNEDNKSFCSLILQLFLFIFLLLLKNFRLNLFMYEADLELIWHVLSSENQE